MIGDDWGFRAPKYAAAAQPTFAGPGRHLKERLKKAKKKV